MKTPMAKNFTRTTVLSILVAFFLIGVVEDADAQRRKRKKRSSSRTEKRSEDYKPFSERLTYEIGIGNNNSFAGINLGLRPAVGYKFGNIANVGIGGRYDFEFVNIINGDDLVLNTFAFFPYAQIKFTQSIYAKGTYEFGRYNSWFQNINTGRFVEDTVTETTPLIGGGYSSGIGDWKWGFEILFVMNEEVRDFTNPLQYWIVASYRL